MIQITPQMRILVGMALSYRTWIVSGVGGQTCDEIAQKSVRATHAQTFPIDIRPTFL